MNVCTFCNGTRLLGGMAGNGPCVCAPLPMTISAVAAAQAGAIEGHAVEVFKVAPPPPGVKLTPTAKKHALAMDTAMGQIAAYGGTWGYGGAQTFLGYPYLAELAQLPEYRNVSETIAKEMTRKWVELVVTGDDGEGETTDRGPKLARLEAAFRKFKVQDKFRRMAELDGFMGRAHLFLDLGERDAGLPVVMDKLRKGCLKGMRVVEPIWTYPTAYNSARPLEPDFYKPREWYVMGDRVHRDRLLTFVGREVADILKPAYAFGGLSRTQMIRPYVDNWIRTRQSVSDITHNFSKSVLSTDLSTILQGGNADTLIRRAQLFNQTRDNRGLIMLNKETEEFIDVSSPLGTLDKLQAQALEQIASAAQMPLVVLLGVTPSGLNASAEGELNVWYERVGSWQEDLFTDNLTIVLQVMQMHLFGKVDPDIGFVYVPLSEEDEAARATTEKTKADTAAVYVDMGAVDPAEVRRVLAADEDSAYHGLSGPPPEPPEVDPATEGAPGEQDDAPDPAETEGSHAVASAGGGGVNDQTIAAISLNGAQVSSMVEVVGKVATGELPVEAAVAILTTAFPIDEAHARKLMSGIVPGSQKPEPVKVGEAQNGQDA